MHGAVVVTLVASLAAGDIRLPAWWEEVQGWLLSLLVFVIARSTLADLRSRGLIMSALAAGVVANAVVAVWQRGTDAGPDSFVVDGAVRVFGVFQHPNTLAAYLSFVLPLFIAASIMTRSPAAWLWRIAAVTGTATLVMTQSRGGMMAFGAAMVVLVALAPRSIQRWIAIGALAAAMLIAATGSIERIPAIDRFANIVPASGPTQVTPETWGQLEREAHWGAAWSMLRSDPLFGVGAGQFNVNYREHTPEWRFRIGRWHAHNGYLQLGAEAGLPGVIAFVGWIGTILVALWRRILRTSGASYLLAAGAMGAAVAWTVNNMFEYQDVPSIPIMFALVVAVGLGGVTVTDVARPRAEATGDVS
jgi:O-antigen ligase